MRRREWITSSARESTNRMSKMIGQGPTTLEVGIEMITTCGEMTRVYPILGDQMEEPTQGHLPGKWVPLEQGSKMSKQVSKWLVALTKKIHQPYMMHLMERIVWGIHTSLFRIKGYHSRSRRTRNMWWLIMQVSLMSIRAVWTSPSSQAMVRIDWWNLGWAWLTNKVPMMSGITISLIKR